MSHNPYLDLDRQIVGDIHTSSNSIDTLTVLCDDFGSRFGGTPGERKAARFIRDRFREYGLAGARLEPYTYASWSRGSAQIQVLNPEPLDIPGWALPYCPSGNITAELVSVGDGAPADFERAGRKLRGKIVMTTSRPPVGLNRHVHRHEKYDRSALAGASAFLFMNHYEGLGPATGSIGGNREALIPGLSVSKESGDRLLRLAKRGPVQIRLKTRNRTRDRTSWNVVGEIPGHQTTEQLVVLGCHYDGHDVSQGAYDPASGMVAVMEAARVLGAYAGDHLGCTVRFIAFGTEEIGLIGSQVYVREHAEEMSRIRLMLNLDAAGGRSRKGIVMHHWPELDEFFRAAREEMAAEIPYGQKLSAFSDHFPFFEAGVPTASMGDAEAAFTGRGFGHTAFDTIDKVRPDDMRTAASVAARLVLRIANAEGWPAKRRSARAVERIKKQDLNMEILEVYRKMDKLYARKRRLASKKARRKG